VPLCNDQTSVDTVARVKDLLKDPPHGNCLNGVSNSHSGLQGGCSDQSSSVFQDIRLVRALDLDEAVLLRIPLTESESSFIEVENTDNDAVEIYK